VLLCAGAIVGGAPLVAPPLAAAAAKPVEKWRPDLDRAKRYARGRTGRVSFAIIDPSGGVRHHHGGRGAQMASTVKVMLLTAYLRQASVRDRALRGADRDLLGPMIRRSDNEAASRVRDIVGEAGIRRVARDASMRHFHYHATWGRCRTSASDQARFMYRFEQYLPRRHEGYARNLLASIVPSQRWGIARANHRGWRLFFKGGWGIGGTVNHQVAFLRRRDARVSIAILTRSNPNQGYGERTLEGVAGRLLRGLPR
jgi:hypothetical protein